MAQDDMRLSNGLAGSKLKILITGQRGMFIIARRIEIEGPL